VAKAPAFQFYVKDWLSDPQLRMASFSTKGIWIDLLCFMWDAPERGVLKTTADKLSRLTGASKEEIAVFIDEAISLRFCDIEKHNNTDITLCNRRMWREDEKRVGNRERQKRYREKGGGNPDKWMAIRLKILELDEYMCAYCGRKSDTVDHVIPKTRGGDESDENLVACCKRCNQKKNNRTPEEAGMSVWDGFKRKNNIKITPLSPSPTPSPTANKENTTSSEPEKSDSEQVPFVLEIPLVSRDGFYGITQEKIDEWSECFPGVNIPIELNKIKAWNIANPRKRKTRRGIENHIVGWLSKTQDKGFKPSVIQGRKETRDICY